jgi:ferredoxin
MKVPLEQAKCVGHAQCYAVDPIFFLSTTPVARFRESTSSLPVTRRSCAMGGRVPRLAIVIEED